MDAFIYRVDSEKFTEIVKNSKNICHALKQLGLSYYGAAYRNFKTRCLKLGIDISHLSDHTWSSKKIQKKIPLEELLTKGSSLRTCHKKRLLTLGILKELCYICGILEWHGKKLSLHLDHINGDHSDNRLENLRILCPNCHSLTPTYCRKKQTDGPAKTKQCFCGKEICISSKLCRSCSAYTHNKTKIQWPSREKLTELLKEKSTRAVAKELGVSDSAIRKHLRNH